MAGDNSSPVYSSLDFGFSGRTDVITDYTIASAAGGTVTRHKATRGDEDCWLDITHGDWTEVYYHVANIPNNLPTGVGVLVPKNYSLGNPSTIVCTLNGSADVSHVHFAIQHRGFFIPISGTLLSGWRVVETGFRNGYLDGPLGYRPIKKGDVVRNLGRCGPNNRFEAEYYNNRTLDGPPVFSICEDAPIHYDWQYGGPDVTDNDNFAVRWRGWFPFESDTYLFEATADDGIRIMVDGEKIIEGWRDQAATRYTAPIALEEGEHEIIVEYYEHYGQASVIVNWRPMPEGSPERLIYDAEHGTALPGKLLRSEGFGPVGVTEVDNAYDFAGDTYFYYWTTFARDSYDNEQGELNITARYGNNYQNAFWNGDQVVLGDRFAVKDVIAHELTHAVIQHTANLEYRWQSGALNESFADIFGVMVDRDDWLMGEDLPDDALGGRDAVRDLSDPTRLGQPDHIDGWALGCEDDERVHANSGIINKAYFEIADLITKEKAERLFYRALVFSLHPTSSLEDARAAVLLAAQDLHGDGSIEYNAVLDGFSSVGLEGNDWNPPPNDCGPCSATVTLKYTSSDAQSAANSLSSLYQLRDDVMSTTSAGKHYQKLYYQHTGRINELMWRNPQLLVQGSMILEDVMPSLAHLAEGRGKQVVLTEEMTSELASFLNNLANEDRKQGGGELAKVIERELDLLRLDHLSGMNFEQAWVNLNKPALQLNSDSLQ